MRLLIFLVALLCAPLVPAAAQEDDRGYLQRLIEDALSGAGREVRIQGFSGALSSEASLERMTIADSEGIWLTLENATLNWTRSALLRGRIDINRLAAERLEVARAPATGESLPAPEASGPFALPELPVAVQIAELEIGSVELGPSFVGEPITLRIAGSADLSDGEGDADLDIERIDVADSRFAINGAFSNETRQLDLSLLLDSTENGLVPNLMGLPGAPALRLSVDGSGPLDDFTADIALATDEQDRLSGQVTLLGTEAGDQQFSVDISGDIRPLLLPEYHDFVGDSVSLQATGAQSGDGGLSLDRLSLVTEAMSLQGRLVVGADGFPAAFELALDIGDEGSAPVLLAIPGAPTRLVAATIDLGYDASEGEAWTLQGRVGGLDRPDLRLDELVLEGSGTLQRGDGPGIGAAAGRIALQADGIGVSDPAIAEAVGDSAQGTLRFDWQPGAPLTIRQIDMAAAGARLTGGLSVQGVDGSVELDIAGDLALLVDDVARFSALAGRELSGSVDLGVEAAISPVSGAFDIVAEGTARDLGVSVPEADRLLAGPVQLRLSAVRDAGGTFLREFLIDGDHMDLTASAELRTGASTGRFEVSLPDLSVPLPELPGSAAASGTFRETAQAWQFDMVASGPGEALFDGDLDFDKGEDGLETMRADGRFEVLDIARFGALAGRDLGGALRIRTDATLDLRDMDFAVTLNGTATDVAVGIPEADRLLRGTVSLAADVSRRGEVIGLEELRIDGDAIDLAANGVLQPGDSSGRFDLTLPDMSIPFPQVSGAARLKGMLDEDTGNYLVDLLADAPGGVRFDGDVTLTKGQETAIAALAVRGDLGATDLSVYRTVARRTLNGALSLSGSGRYDLTNGDGALDIIGQATDLAVGVPEADRLLRGTTTLNLDVERAGETITLRDARIDNRVLTLDADGVIRPGASQATFDLALSDVSVPLPKLSGAARLAGSLRENAQDYLLDLDASAPGGVLFDGDIALSKGDTAYDVTALAVDGRAEVGSLAAYSAIAGRPLAGALTVQGAGKYDIVARTAAADIDGFATALRTGISSADALLRGRTDLDLVIETTADGSMVFRTAEVRNPQVRAEVAGTFGAEQSDLSFDLGLSDVALLVPQFPGAATARGTARRDGGDWRIDTDLTGPGGIAAAAAGSIAPDFQRANLSVDGQAPLGLANPFIEPRLVDGLADFDLAVNGPLALNSVSGTVRATGAEFVLPTLSQVLRDIDVTGTLTNGRITVDLSGAPEEGGRVTVGGPITLSAPFAADLAIGIRDVVLADPNLFQTLLDGDLTFVGPLTGGARLAGVVTLGQTELRVPETGMGGTTRTFELTHLREPAEVRASRARAGLLEEGQGNGGTEGGGAAYPLDLTIDAPGRIFIRGRGLDAELGGELRLTGTTQNVVPQGRFDLLRGRLDLLGQRLTLTEGFAQLQGDFDPFLRLVAETEREDTLIRIVVQGLATEPDVEITSSPERPEEEVLALLLFGRDVTEISAVQALRIAAAVNTLAGRGGGGIINNLRMSFGLDDLDIATGADGGTELRLGKYISENIYTDVALGQDGDTEINLNLELTDHITARGSVDNDGTSSIGIFFERDY